MFDDEDEEVDLGEAFVKHEKGGAILVNLLDRKIRDVWIPKSQVTDSSEVWKKGQEPGRLVITKWFAQKEGLE